MSKNDKYKIVQSPGRSELEEWVQRLIRDGWEPLGGVSVATREPDHSIYAQAMIYREPIVCVWARMRR